MKNKIKKPLSQAKKTIQKLDRQRKRLARRRKVLRKKAYINRVRSLQRSYNCIDKNITAWQEGYKRTKDWIARNWSVDMNVSKEIIHSFSIQLRYLSPATISTLNSILLTCNNNLTCYKRQDTIAQEINYCRGTVNRSIKKLTKTNLIHVESQGLKKPCLITVNSLFHNLIIRNNFSHLLPALKYLPLIGILLMQLAFSSNVTQHLKRVYLYNNIFKLRSNTSKNQTSKLGDEVSNFYKKTQKGEKCESFSMPVVRPYVSRKQNHHIQSPSLSSLISTITSAFTMNNKTKKNVPPPARQLENIHLTLEPKKVIITHEMKLDNDLQLLHEELEEFRKMVIRSKDCTLEAIKLYNDFRTFINDLKNIPQSDHRTILISQKRRQLHRFQYKDSYTYPDVRAQAAHDM